MYGLFFILPAIQVSGFSIANRNFPEDVKDDGGSSMPNEAGLDGDQNPDESNRCFMLSFIIQVSRLQKGGISQISGFQ